MTTKPSERIVEQLANARKTPAGPWGDEHPVAWARKTGRIGAKAEAAWRADFERDPAGTGRWLSRLQAVPQAALDTPAETSTVDEPIAELGIHPRVAQSAAGSGKPAPQLFAGSTGLPPITASGIPAERLAELPWQARWPVAEERDPKRALDMFHHYASVPEAAEVDFGGHARNVAYAQDVERWASENASVDAIFAANFGDQALATAQQREAQHKAERREAARRALDAIDDE